MANGFDEFDKNIENLKDTVKKSFTRIYATLKARELKTLRQIEALRKQCQDNRDLRDCVQNINISYENESMLFDNISNYGVIDFEKLNFDSNAFTLEDYVSPNDDHMYSYKTIEELTKDDDLAAIEEAALKQITKTDNCVCFVHIRTEDVSKKFREIYKDSYPIKNLVHKCPSPSLITETDEVQCSENITEDEISDNTDGDIKKINPTDDWLNSIKSQTETEPTQVDDVMEHSTIACS